MGGEFSISGQKPSGEEPIPTPAKRRRVHEETPLGEVTELTPMEVEEVQGQAPSVKSAQTLERVVHERELISGSGSGALGELGEVSQKRVSKKRVLPPEESIPVVVEGLVSRLEKLENVLQANEQALERRLSEDSALIQETQSIKDEVAEIKSAVAQLIEQYGGLQRPPKKWKES